MAELEKTFKQNGGEWKEFRIGDLFISYNGDFDIQKTHLNDRGFYVVSSGEQNMGIIGKTDLEARIFPKNTITCDMFGNVYYRNFDYKMVTHARVFCLEFIAGNLNEKIALFIISAMKFLRFKFQYSNMASWRKIQDLTISLPVYNPARHCEDDRTKRSIEINKMDCHDSATAESRNDNKDKNYTIAFDFMEKYIQELEAYLLVARLKDTRLTEKEKEALRIFATLEDSAIRGGGGINRILSAA
ncbi:restriction endonuclease subunit S [uncultured Helicobacter sp.]|uniref:restriction endonuclease subunit S n=1 Tax=uncultured Helicobacter sp. TaxID=175537 RepID=UPI00260B2F07|nr:restriction endonuclease subunit S [uncultured Helicobacter sp.]